MSQGQLDNLVKSGQLKSEPPAQAEFGGLVHSGQVRLKDAGNTTNSLEGRFDLAYNAAHALALAALRWHGYRSESRYIVFQTLQHTLNLPPEQWRVLDQAHRKRNIAEYEGVVDIDENLLAALIRVVTEVEKRVIALGPVRET
ncbi:MAG: hypothetical protein ACT4PS_06415 [Betaproteobacteria bacterium]